MKVILKAPREIRTNGKVIEIDDELARKLKSVGLVDFEETENAMAPEPEKAVRPKSKRKKK
jgi:hypothetical protein